MNAAGRLIAYGAAIAVTFGGAFVAAGAVVGGVVALLALLAAGCWMLVSSCPLRTARHASHTPRGT